MQVQHLPVLIFAQSGRYLAQSASQAGYTVWVADCFGDRDTLSAAHRWQGLPAFAELSRQSIVAALSELTRGESCMLMCGSGIEQSYSLLFPLPVNIQLIGNAPDTIRKIKTPVLFFQLLEQLNFNYPATVFKPSADDLTWLKKKASGLGGTHIEYADLNTNEMSTEYYYQRFVSGASGSCLFLADGYHAQLLTINQQFPAAASDKRPPFLLGRIESAWQLSTLHKNNLNRAINQITAATMLVGLNSLDFILSDQNELLMLEINPRPSASAELVKNSAALFQHHVDACLGQLPDPQKGIHKTKTSLFYHYASTNYIIPEKMIWPSECSDLPSQGTIIKQNQPICSSQVEDDQYNDAIKSHLIIEQKILKQLDKTK